MPGLNPNLSRRRLLAAGASVPLAAFLASCGNSSDNSSGGGSKGGGGKPTALGLSDWWGQQFDAYLPTMEQKTGIKINHEVYSYAPEKIFTELASGTAPDMYLVDAYWNGNLFPYKKLYVPYDDRLKARGIDMSKFNADPHKETGFDGKIASLSLYTGQDFIVHINKELADKGGLLKDAPIWGSPTFDTWKWDTFVDWLKEGTHRTSSGKVEQYGIGSVPVYASWFSAMLYDFGGTLYDEDWNYDETVSKVDSDEAVAAITVITDLFTKHKVAVPTGTETAIRGGSYLAKKCMCTITLSTPSIYPEAGNFPMEYIHQPYNVTKTHCFGGGSISVNGASKYPDAALDWVITFVTDTDIRTKFLQTSSVPAYDPLPIVNASPEGTPKKIALINLSRIKDMSTIPANTTGVVDFPRWFGRYASTATQNTIQSAMDQIILGKATPKQAMADAKKQIDEAIANGRKAAGKS